MDSFDWDAVKYLQLKDPEPIFEQQVVPTQIDDTRLPSKLGTNGIDNEPLAQRKASLHLNQSDTINTPKSTTPSPLTTRNTITMETVKIGRERKSKIVKAIEDQDLDELFGSDDDIVETKDIINSSSVPMDKKNKDEKEKQQLKMGISEVNDQKIVSRNHFQGVDVRYEVPQIPSNQKIVNKVEIHQHYSLTQSLVSSNVISPHNSTDIQYDLKIEQQVKELKAPSPTSYNDQLIQIFDSYSDKNQVHYEEIDQIFVQYSNDDNPRNSLDAFMDLIGKTNRMDSQCAEFKSKTTFAKPQVPKKALVTKKDDLESILDIIESTSSYDNQTAEFRPKKEEKLKLPNRLLSIKNRKTKEEKRQSLPIQELESIFDLISKKQRSYDDQSAVFTRNMESISESWDESTEDGNVPSFEEFPKIEQGNNRSRTTKMLTRGWTKLKNKLKTTEAKEDSSKDLSKGEELTTPVFKSAEIPMNSLQSNYQSLPTIQDGESKDDDSTNQSSCPPLSKRISLIFGIDAPVRTIETTIHDRQVTAVYQSDSDTDSFDSDGRTEWI